MYDIDEENMDSKTMDELLGEINKSHGFKVVMLLVCIGLFLNIMMGYTGFILMLIIVLFCRYAPGEEDTDKWNVNSAARGEFGGPEGLYRVYRTGWFTSRCAVGTAFARDGVLQSRLHVVGNAPKSITYQGRESRAYYYDKYPIVA